MAVKRLDEAGIAAAVPRVPSWRRTGDAIERTFRFHGFPESVSFVTRVAFLAEAANHHPDIDVRWTKVRLVLTTHVAKGLTENDFALAERIDHVAAGWALE